MTSLTFVSALKTKMFLESLNRNPCGMSVANAFFNDPKKQPEIDCFDNISNAKFINE